MSLWKYNDVELEISLSNVKFQKRYEAALKAMEKKEAEIQKAVTLTDVSEAYCMMFFNFFDTIFGAGTSDKLFNGEMDTFACNECYSSFIDACKQNITEINKRQVVIAKKYKPAQGMKF